jgi:DNA-binding Lrp family transcriptional regulator
MNALPSISAQIDEKIISNTLRKNYVSLAPNFISLISNWLVRAYKNYNDIDKFIIIIYLINKDLSFYRRNGINIDYETFYKDKTLEIQRINISDISKDLDIPKETVRRKVSELEKNSVIKKTGKKIFLNRSAFLVAQANNTLSDLCILLHKFNILLKKDNLTNIVFDINQINKSIKDNFTFCWYQFYKFMFIYLKRWKKEVKDLETFCVGMVVVVNAAQNKEFKPSKSNIKSWRQELMGSDTRGVNAMSISEITTIPRPTVVRKLKWLIEKKYLNINDKKLISLNVKDSTFKKSARLHDQNMLSLSYLIHRLFNQIKVINS